MKGVILPRDSDISRLLIDHTHRVNLHSGPTSTLASLRQRFWIIRAKDIIKIGFRSCPTCTKDRATASTQLMGSLPAARVTSSPPFNKCGVDYAGPVFLKQPGKATLKKGYIALFVCLCTKAVHIELVESLTSADFIAALRRFTSRRGLPSEIWSDNASTFVSADKNIRELYSHVRSKYHNNVVFTFLSSIGVEWKYIPPVSPHFGGLWERGVRTMKSHLRRHLGNAKLTLLELSTILCQVEVIMNSRPLCPISNDPSEPEILTPAHFLIGRPLDCLPDATTSSDEERLSPLVRWDYCQHLTTSLWERWKTEYLQSLQARNRWKLPQRNLSTGDVVLLMEPKCPRLSWPIGVIIETSAGNDNLVRVARVKTKKGVITRPISKLILFVENQSTDVDLQTDIPMSTETEAFPIETPLSHDNRTETEAFPIETSSSHDKRTEPIETAKSQTRSGRTVHRPKYFY